MLRALIFDVDGTLADTERDGHRVAFNRAFADAGLAWHWDEELYGRLLEVAGGKERIRHFATHDLPRPPVPAEALESWIESLHAAKSRHFLDLLRSGEIRPRPGIKRLIEEARHAGVRLAIATTSHPHSVKALFAGSGFPIAQNWFEVVAAGDVVACKKPAADIYRLVLGRMNLQASECLALEDSRQGLSAALGAGIPTLVTVTAYTAAQDFAGAAAVLEHLGDPDCPLTGRQPGTRPWIDLDQLRRWSDPSPRP